jgi:hypothetical protein
VPSLRAWRARPRRNTGLRQRARIVLLAANGMASRAIGREVGCTTGTASKWRVRYARDRLAGLDETGERGAEPKYTAETRGARPAGAGRIRALDRTRSGGTRQLPSTITISTSPAPPRRCLAAATYSGE